MKKALYLFVVYIVVFVSFSLIAPYVVDVAGNVYNQVNTDYTLTIRMSGTKLSLFDSKLFLQGLLNYFPICGAFSILPLCFYLIKHKFRVLEYIFQKNMIFLFFSDFSDIAFCFFKIVFIEIADDDFIIITGKDGSITIFYKSTDNKILKKNIDE